MPDCVSELGDLETLEHAVDTAMHMLTLVKDKHLELQQTNRDLHVELTAMNSSCDELLAQKQVNVNIHLTAYRSTESV